jgi:diguanylate cyclase (GGDEF)-like protein
LLLSVIASQGAEIEKLRSSVLQDPLTGLWNEAYYLKRMAEEIAKVERARYEHERTTGVKYEEGTGFEDKDCLLALLYLDLDGFKEFNDWHGHDHANGVLKKVGNAAKQALRRSDSLLRLHGDEFLAILPRTDLAQAKRVAEKVAKKIKCLAGVTVSVGAAAYEIGDDPLTIRCRAEKKMYEAKRERSRRVGVAVEAG